MNDYQKTNKLHLHNVGRILLPLFVWCTKQASEIGSSARSKTIKALKKLLLSDLQQLRVSDFISILEGKKSAMKRYKWLYVPISWVQLAHNEVINTSFERLELSKNDNSKLFQQEILSKTALLMALRLLGVILETKERNYFERDLSEISLKLFKRFNIKLDDPNLYQNIKRQIINVERDLNRISKIAEAEQARLNSEQQGKTLTASEAVMSLLHAITNTVDRSMYLVDFFVVYNNYKKQVRNEKQNK
jgi:hypothetical protein